jgi:hypothetical protein
VSPVEQLLMLWNANPYHQGREKYLLVGLAVRPHLHNISATALDLALSSERPAQPSTA